MCLLRYRVTVNRRADSFVVTLARTCRRHAGLNTGSAARRRLGLSAASGVPVNRGVVKHRDVSAIDRQLSLLAAVSSSIRRLGGKPSTALIDELLDERIASRPVLAPAGRGDGDGNTDQRDDGSQN